MRGKLAFACYLSTPHANFLSQDCYESTPKLTEQEVTEILCEKGIDLEQVPPPTPLLQLNPEDRKFSKVKFNNYIDKVCTECWRFEVMVTNLLAGNSAASYYSTRSSRD